MRVVQLIDSLEAGGAERMAVNYANGLSENIALSALVVTRQEGVLKEQLGRGVSYLFLQRKCTFDCNALFRLKSFIKKNEITLVHAHGTSFFLAFLLKLIYPKIKIIWHEHYGARVRESLSDNWILFFCSKFFAAIFVVNNQLEQWGKQTLWLKRVFYIPNFAATDENSPKTTFLQGAIGKRIVCLANLKEPKNHITILMAFKALDLDLAGWTLHFVGKVYHDTYSDTIKAYITANNLETAVFLLDVRNDIQHILSQATIGVLASTAEGFPVALLEYGLAKLPVLSTNVGYCPEIIKEGVNGLLFNPLDTSQLQYQLYKITNDSSISRQFGLNLQQLVIEHYSSEVVMKLLLSKYKSLHLAYLKS
jgi:glycosyltransferase involved in cell wall biosynthesis